MADAEPRSTAIGTRLLVVEDDPDHRYLLMRGLKEIYGAAANVAGASCLADAQSLLARETFDCIVLDLTLGDASGVTAIERVKAVTDAPIVVLTGRGDLGVTALAHGASAFLEKSVARPDTVATAIDDSVLAADVARERSHLAAIVNSSSLAMFFRDTNGTILTWNPGAEAIYGYRSEEIVGRDWRVLVPDHLVPKEAAITEMVLRGGTVSRYETQRVRKDGSLVDIGLNLSAVRNADGEVIGISVIARDITREKATERERDLFSGIVNSTLGAIVSSDLEGRITSWNHGAERLFGYTRDEVLGQSTEMLLPEDLADGSDQLVARLTRGDRIDAVETVRRCKDGRLVDVVITGSEIYDQNGIVIGLAAIYHDVTDRKAVERELARRTAQLEEAQEIASLGSWDFDPVTNSVTWSDEMYRLFGYEPGAFEVTLESILDTFHPDDRVMVERLLEEALREGSDPSAELRIRRGDGSEGTINVRGRTVEQDGRLMIVGSAQDVTERKKLEAQLLQSQKMEALGGLAGGIAHDFNNLLAVILNYGTFISEDLPEDSPMRADIDAVIHAAQRGAALVRQLLAFSRKEVVRPEVVNLNLLISQMEPLIRRLVRESIALETNLSLDLWDTTADRGQLEQVLLNLVVNARDAMPSGGKILITTSNVVADEAFTAIHPDFEPGRYACMTVSDVGTGMSKETQARIFEPFFTTKPIGSGTGLGLSTVYGIVKRSGGFITVYSEVGLGTTFRVYMPAATVTVEYEEIEPVQLSLTGRGERVVVVEDEEPVLGMITRILSDNGYEVVPISSPEDALVRLQNDDSVCLLLTDVVMPQMSGRALSEAARVPTVFMSGYTDSIIEQQGVLQEGVVFLPKPFSADELLSVIRSTIDDRTRADRIIATE